MTIRVDGVWAQVNALIVLAMATVPHARVINQKNAPIVREPGNAGSVTGQAYVRLAMVEAENDPLPRQRLGGARISALKRNHDNLVYI